MHGHIVAALREMVRGCCYCCCCCCWCVQSTPVKPRAVRSIEARGYYTTFLGGGHPGSPSLSLFPSCARRRRRATFCSIPKCPKRLFSREGINRARVSAWSSFPRARRGVFVANFVSKWWWRIFKNTFRSCSLVQSLLSIIWIKFII